MPLFHYTYQYAYIELFTYDLSSAYPYTPAPALLRCHT